MHDFLGSVASLTGSRDRDLIDAAAITLLSDWLRPAAARLYRCVGEPSDTRLLLLSSARRGEPTLPGDPPWTAPEALPRVCERPDDTQALASGRPLLDRPLPGEPGAAQAAPLLRSVFPIWIGPQRAGMLELVDERPLDEEQRRLVAGVLTIYCNQIGLLDYSERDTLTGLLNRRTFDERFGKCLLDLARAESCASAAPADTDGRRRADAGVSRWIGVLDIDHFKRVNDTFGHLIGDEVLLLLGRLLRQSFRHGDELYRFGGEEFVVLLRAEGRANAALAFERFRERMSEYRFPQVGAVTVSIGFTEVRSFDTPAAAFERADRAVYHAKEHGRNQVHCHEVLIDTGRLEASAEVGEIGAIELF